MRVSVLVAEVLNGQAEDFHGRRPVPLFQCDCAGTTGAALSFGNASPVSESAFQGIMRVNGPFLFLEVLSVRAT